MTDSLRDQLLGLGFKPAPKPERSAQSKGGAGRPERQGRESSRPPNKGGVQPGGRATRKPGGARKPRSQGEIDLAKAYAIRAQREKEERIAAEQARQEAARLRREARAKLSEFLAGKALNDKEAEIARHFEYGGKIKRIYVNAEQLRALNAGELGVVQDGGRYVLISAVHLDEAAAIFADAVALKIDPNAPKAADPYADPRYQIPDDLVW